MTTRIIQTDERRDMIPFTDSSACELQQFAHVIEQANGPMERAVAKLGSLFQTTMDNACQSLREENRMLHCQNRENRALMDQLITLYSEQEKAYKEHTKTLTSEVKKMNKECTRLNKKSERRKCSIIALKTEVRELRTEFSQFRVCTQKTIELQQAQIRALTGQSNALHGRITDDLQDLEKRTDALAKTYNEHTHGFVWNSTETTPVGQRHRVRVRASSLQGVYPW
jgi:predicted RNase H-like nuclease (RuvC/YqgF family)